MEKLYVDGKKVKENQQAKLNDSYFPLILQLYERTPRFYLDYFFPDSTKLHTIKVYIL